MYCFSSLLMENNSYKPAADRLFNTLKDCHVSYQLLDRTRDIWMRDFMPVKTRIGKYVSFRYDPVYLRDSSELRIDFKTEIAPYFPLSPLTYSDIILDGGNIVFSPSKETAIISDRIFSENQNISRNTLIQQLERLLEAQVIIIPSLKSDMTGHADGMVRFLDENTVLGNSTTYTFGLETRIKLVMQNHGIRVYDFPYFDSAKESAVGCYLNFLDTENYLFLPLFNSVKDKEAISCAEKLFTKQVVPIDIREIASDGGCLNCISWEF